MLDNTRFASYSSALIPRDELLNKHVKIGIHATRMKYKVMGYPVGLSVFLYCVLILMRRCAKILLYPKNLSVS